ncbi:hypothetical protein SLEP1_g1612 [Rubroshorea leprosula]|uniref:Uncharacterized protein n=1 Tax=Rubroshorea leprosula TaxID=152421 RepID=A0AAV5HEB0_9ROSI|nr:hypothetical protein SLEP1_g1612 [Rubroshorea leprosula]
MGPELSREWGFGFSISVRVMIWEGKVGNFSKERKIMEIIIGLSNQIPLSFKGKRRENEPNINFMVAHRFEVFGGEQIQAGRSVPLELRRVEVFGFV